MDRVRRIQSRSASPSRGAQRYGGHGIVYLEHDRCCRTDNDLAPTLLELARRRAALALSHHPATTRPSLDQSGHLAVADRRVSHAARALYRRIALARPAR